MGISSIHIEAGAIGFFSHNSREKATVNSIFFDEENFTSCNNKAAIKFYKNELELRSRAYKKRTNQNIQKNTITHLSAIVNFNENHTSLDMQKVCKHLEEKFDTKIIQYSMHRDEGHIIDGEAIKNYHAHIEFMGIDSEGNSIRRKLDKRSLSELQTEVAKLLNMERGTNYAKSMEKRPKRLGTHEFKEAKKRETAAKKATAKDLKDGISKLRKELKEANAGRADYAKLEDYARKAKEHIKKQNLYKESLETGLKELYIAFFNGQKISFPQVAKVAKVKISKLQEQIDSDKMLINALKSQNKQKDEEIIKLDKKIASEQKKSLVFEKSFEAFMKLANFFGINKINKIEELEQFSELFKTEYLKKDRELRNLKGEYAPFDDLLEKEEKLKSSTLKK